MDFRALLLPFIFLVVVSTEAANGDLVCDSDSYTNASIVIGDDSLIYDKEKNPVTGKYTAYHENGTKKEEGCLKDGKREGSFTYWGNYEEEVVVGTKTYKNGKLDGYWSSFVCTPKCCYEGWDGNYVNGENIRGWHWNFGCTKPVEGFVNNAD